MGLSGSGFGLWGFRVGFRVYGFLGLWAYGLGFRVEGLGFRAFGLGFRAWVKGLWGSLESSAWV